MRVRSNYVYVDAIKWRGDANYRQVCDFVGVTDRPEVADRKGIYLPGRDERRAVPGDWVISHYMVGGDCIALDGRGFARHYDQRGVSAAGLADQPFRREGVSRYRSRPNTVEALHWSGDAAFGAVCELVGADAATADRDTLALPRHEWEDEDAKISSVRPGMWVLRWDYGGCMAVNSAWLLDHYAPEDPAERLVPGVERYRERTEGSYARAIYWSGPANYTAVCDFLGVAPQAAPEDQGVLRPPSRYTARDAFPGSWFVCEEGTEEFLAENWNGFMEHRYDMVIPQSGGPLGHPALWQRPQRFRQKPRSVLALLWRGRENLAEVSAFIGRPLDAGDDPKTLHLPGRDELAVTPGLWIILSASSYSSLSDENFRARYEPDDAPDDPRDAWGAAEADTPRGRW
ncbi:hypothetical protein AB0M29_24760 [Streptomyces sp. NPDC051976]|uniref:hypothetical protein n=1 Tax=Streptomyces sp. NPDC051976 TaxID=3154947 RepID=UPI00342A830D